MLPRVVECRYLAGHPIWLRCSDGAEGVIDLSEELPGPMFDPLRDVELLRQFDLHPELEMPVWPNGADFVPGFLRSSLRVAV